VSIEVESNEVISVFCNVCKSTGLSSAQRTTCRGKFGSTWQQMWTHRVCCAPEPAFYNTNNLFSTVEQYINDVSQGIYRGKEHATEVHCCKLAWIGP